MPISNCNHDWIDILNFSGKKVKRCTKCNQEISMEEFHRLQTFNLQFKAFLSEVVKDEEKRNKN